MFRPVQFGKYYLTERIAVGGMAEIFKASLRGVSGFEKPMVVKQILPQYARQETFIQMFIDEAKIAVSLTHGNIVPVYELGRIDGIYFLAMDYVRGYDLAEILEQARARRMPLPVDQAVFIAIEVCKGLDYAHRLTDDQGVRLEIVHRDIGPHNVMVSLAGEVKITDFGIAKAAHKLRVTQAGQVKGTYGYMSPEQVRGQEVDQRTDIFSTGIVLHEMLTGRRLFSGGNDLASLERVKQADVIAPSEVASNVSTELDEIVLKALAADREQRYQTASAMQLDLSRYLFSSGGATSASVAGYLRKLFPKHKRPRSKPRARPAPEPIGQEEEPFLIEALHDDSPLDREQTNIFKRSRELPQPDVPELRFSARGGTTPGIGGPAEDDPIQALARALADADATARGSQRDDAKAEQPSQPKDDQPETSEPPPGPLAADAASSEQESAPDQPELSTPEADAHQARDPSGPRPVEQASAERAADGHVQGGVSHADTPDTGAAASSGSGLFGSSPASEQPASSDPAGGSSEAEQPATAEAARPEEQPATADGPAAAGGPAAPTRPRKRGPRSDSSVMALLVVPTSELGAGEHRAPMHAADDNTGGEPLPDPGLHEQASPPGPDRLVADLDGAASPASPSEALSVPRSFRPALWGWSVVLLLVVAAGGFVLYKKTSLFSRDSEPNPSDEALLDTPLSASTANQTSEPPSASEPEAGTSRGLTISTQPDDALLFMHVGDAPKRVDRFPSDRKSLLRLELDGYRPVYVVVDPERLERGGALEVELTQGDHHAQPPPGPLPKASGKPSGVSALEVRSEPPGASIWLYLGSGRVDLGDLAPQRYYFMALRQGYEPSYRPVPRSAFDGSDGAISETIELAARSNGPAPANTSDDEGEGSPPAAGSDGDKARSDERAAARRRRRHRHHHRRRRRRARKPKLKTPSWAQ